MKMYSLSCKDAGIEKCDYIAMGESKEEVIEMAKNHFMKAHPKEAKAQMENMSEKDMKEKMMSKIKQREEDM